MSMTDFYTQLSQVNAQSPAYWQRLQAIAQDARLQLENSALVWFYWE